MRQVCYHAADSQLLPAKCLSVQVVVATSKRQKSVDGTMKPGLLWDVPLMLGKQKEGSDRNRIQCIVFDFVVHPDTCRMALNNAKFKVSISIKCVTSPCQNACHHILTGLYLTAMSPSDTHIHRTWGSSVSHTCPS